MYKSQHEIIQKGGLPKPTQFINRRVMCGACSYKCCISTALSVECSESEQKSLNLPKSFMTGARCPCLGDHGCSHGENRPVLCKMSPLCVKESKDPKKPPSLIISHWFILNCPASTDYVFMGQDADGKYLYERKEVSGAKRNNSRQTLTLEKPIEDMFPRAIDACSEAVDILYGPGTAKHLDSVLNDKPEGFGFDK